MLESVLWMVVQLGVPSTFDVSAEFAHDLHGVRGLTTCHFIGDRPVSCLIEFNWYRLGNKLNLMKHEACHVVVWYEHGRDSIEDLHGPEWEECMKRPLQ